MRWPWPMAHFITCPIPAAYDRFLRVKRLRPAALDPAAVEDDANGSGVMNCPGLPWAVTRKRRTKRGRRRPALPGRIGYAVRAERRWSEDPASGSQCR